MSDCNRTMNYPNTTNLTNNNKPRNLVGSRKSVDPQWRSST